MELKSGPPPAPCDFHLPEELWSPGPAKQLSKMLFPSLCLLHWTLRPVEKRLKCSSKALPKLQRTQTVSYHLHNHRAKSLGLVVFWKLQKVYWLSPTTPFQGRRTSLTSQVYSNSLGNTFYQKPETVLSHSQVMNHSLKPLSAPHRMLS
jgi:hypothetical protein